MRPTKTTCLLLAWALPLTAAATPNQHLNPHPDDAGKISWQQAPGTPNTTNHLHIEDVSITVLRNVGITHDNRSWVAESAWDDRFLRFVDTPAGTNGAWDSFAHGYIDPLFRPRYLFANDVPAAAQTLVNDAMSTWNTRAKNEGEELRTTPDGTPLKTSVVFERVLSGAHELLVDFMEGFQNVTRAVGEWIVSTTQTAGYPPGQTPATKTLLFEATPTSQFTLTTANWLLSTDGRPLGDPAKVYSDVSAPFATDWSFDKTPDILFNQQDVDYRGPDGTEYEGDEAAFAAFGVRIRDLWGGYPALVAGSTLDIYKSDLYSIALHEWGHVIGLLHSDDGLMAADAPFTMNHLSQTIDADNAFGAAALYSIPVPAPATGVLVMAGVLGMIAWRRSGRCAHEGGVSAHRASEQTRGRQPTPTVTGHAVPFPPRGAPEQTPG